MTKTFSYLRKIFVIGLVLLFLFLSAFVLLLQTERGKNFLQKKIEKTAQQEGIDLHIYALKGSLPFTWKIGKIIIEVSENDQAVLENVAISFSPWSLLHQKIVIKSCDISKMYWKHSLPKQVPLSKEFKKSSLPKGTFQIKSFHIDHLFVENPKDHVRQEYTLDGRGKYRNKENGCFLTLWLKDHISQSEASLRFEENSRKKTQLEVSATISSLQILAPFHHFAWDANFSLAATLSGSEESFTTIFEKPSQEKYPRPLHGKVFAEIRSTSLPNYSFFNTPYTIQTQFSLWPDHAVEVPLFHLESALADIKMQAKLTEFVLPKNIQMSIKVPDLASWGKLLSLPMKGSLEGTLSYKEETLQGKLHGNTITCQQEEFTNLVLTLSAKKQDSVWRGDTFLSLDHPNIPISLSSELSLSFPFSLECSNLSITSKESEIQGAAAISSPLAIRADIQGNFPNLEQFAHVFTMPSNLLGSASFTVKSDASGIQADITANEVLFNEVSFEEGVGHISVPSSFPSEQVKAAFTIHDIYYHNLYLSTLSPEITYANQRLNCICTGDGVWNEPCEFSFDASLEKKDSGHTLTVKKLEGSILNHHFSFLKPSIFSFASKTFWVQDVFCGVENGFFTFDANLSQTDTEFHLQAKHLPLDFFSFFSPHFRMEGYFSLNSAFESHEQKSAGHLELLLEKASLFQQVEQPVFEAKGSIFANMEQEKIQVHSHIVGKEGQFLDLSLTLPCTYSSFPPSFTVLPNPLAGKLQIHGNLEELFDFLNVGSQRFTGQISSDLFLFGTSKDPKLQGSITLEKGSYENYLSGTYVKDVSIDARAEGNQIEVSSFTGKDTSNGTMTGKGNMTLDFERKLPFLFTAKLDQVEAIQLDHFQASCSGDLTIEGDLTQAKLSGDVLVPNADITIPDKLPYDIPDLPVIYINMPHSPPTPVDTDNFPLSLDVHLSAPKKVFVVGRGLHSEWEGHLDISSEDSSVKSKGQLELIRGSFAFAGKKFTLSKGEIICSDKEGQNIFIELQGSLTLPDLTVIATLRGPLLSPQLTFQSIPALPTSAILAKILFNKEISEISPLQAIQLAQTIITLSGQSGLDVLETIRRGLGVDRLTVVSSDTNPDEVFVQIGKYIVQGVMVTLSQGADSSQVIVEVELKNGFIFQAETEQEQEGKFSLKWNYNY